MSEDKYKLDKADLITLLGSYMQILPPRWESFQNYITIYVTLILGLFTLVIAGVKDFNTFPLNLLLLIGSILILVLSDYAKKTIKRQNSHIKELIVVIAKLEFQLGLYDTSQERDNLTENKPWSEDKSFLPPKWIEQRLKSGKDSTKFIQELQPSTASISSNIFTGFQIFAVLVSGFILFLPHMPIGHN